jgi:hypothetical protein
MYNNVRSRSLFRIYSTLHAAPRQQRHNRLYLLAGVGVGVGLGVTTLIGIQRRDPTLAPNRWSQATVVSSVASNSDPSSHLVELQLSSDARPASLPGPVWSLYVKDDDIQIERPFTPLDGIQKNGRVTLWVKRYPESEVSNWLCAKSPGSVVELRGPVQTIAWDDERDKWDEVVMASPKFFHRIPRSWS